MSVDNVEWAIKKGESHEPSQFSVISSQEETSL